MTKPFIYSWRYLHQIKRFRGVHSIQQVQKLFLLDIKNFNTYFQT